MDELPPKAAALLAAARRQHQPSEADEKRVRAALAATLASSVTGSVTPELAARAADGASVTASSGLLTPTLGKLALLTGLLGGTAALWTGWSGAPAPRPDAPAIEARAQSVDAVSAPQPARLAVAPSAWPAVADTEPEPPVVLGEAASRAPAPVAARVKASGRVAARRVRPARSTAERIAAATQSQVQVISHAPPASALAPAAAPAAPASAAPSEPPTTFAEARGSADELALIRTALAQLNAGQAEQALALLARHAARYPLGVMAEERLGLSAIALCEAGQREAGAAAQRSFLRQAPNSPLAARVRGACPESQP